MDSYEGEDRGRCDQAHRSDSDTFVHIEKQTMLIASVRGLIVAAEAIELSLIFSRFVGRACAPMIIP
jgi:hypothetical protein